MILLGLLIRAGQLDNISLSSNKYLISGSQNKHNFSHILQWKHFRLYKCTYSGSWSALQQRGSIYFIIYLNTKISDMYKMCIFISKNMHLSFFPIK